MTFIQVVLVGGVGGLGRTLQADVNRVLGRGDDAHPQVRDESFRREIKTSSADDALVCFCFSLVLGNNGICLCYGPVRWWERKAKYRWVSVQNNSHTCHSLWCAHLQDRQQMILSVAKMATICFGTTRCSRLYDAHKKKTHLKITEIQNSATPTQKISAEIWKKCSPMRDTESSILSQWNLKPTTKLQESPKITPVGHWSKTMTTSTSIPAACWEH